MFRLLAALAVTALAALPRPAVAEVDRLAAALKLPEVLAVIRQEGIAYGQEIDREMLGGTGGAAWAATVAQIYDGARLEAVLTEPLAAALAGQDTGAMAAFFEAPLGQRIVDLEIDAREAFLDEGVEEAAKLRVAEMETAADARLGRIDAFIAAGDLVEANVAGGLNSNLAFWRGLADGGLADESMGEDDILAEVWAQEEDLRADTTEWLRAYLAVAYEPLSDADLEAYIAFMRSPAGAVLNQAMFAAFDRMFGDVSYRLGREAARGLAGAEL